MKRIIPIFIFALLAALPEAQAQNTLHSPDNRPRTYYGDPVLKRNSSSDIDTGKSLYQQIKIDDTTSFLFDEYGKFQYIGEIRLSTNGKYFPSGEGISRSIVANPKTGVAEYRYDLGSWKRGSRHGVFLVKLEDGSYRTETWKWNRCKSAAAVDPTAEEIARMEDAITRIETLLRVTDI